MHAKEILDEKVTFQKGPFQRVRRWWKGIHLEKGTLHRGWSGWETIEEKDRILPLRTFTIREPMRQRRHPSMGHSN